MVTILLVEDDAHMAAALRHGLGSDGFRVDIVNNGTEGLWYAQTGNYDAIVLDIMLPGMNGYRLCQALREAGDWTPVLMLTAKDGELDETEALDTGADDFLSKPFSYAVLVARLRALLRRGRRGGPAPLTAGDLQLDPAAHRVWRGAVPVALSPRQFSLLEFLLRRAGEVVSKTDILDHVWDFAFDGDPNIVEVYIGQLRRKLDAPFGRHVIETIRLVGYRLDPDGG